MAQFLSILCFLTYYFTSFVISQPPLNSAEKESVYRVLESINSDYPWRSLFADDLCYSGPHGVICEYSDDTLIPHVTELSFGLVSDYSPYPTCTTNSTLDPSLFQPLTQLKRLFFYKCFTQTSISFPDFSTFSSSLEELVFIENPSLFGSIDGKIRNLKSLTKLILTGSNVSGEISNGGFGELINLEQITLSGNKLHGEIQPSFFQKMKKMKVLDLSGNGFHGELPESIGNMTELLKIDLSYNRFSGRIPETLKVLKKLEFLDLSKNELGSFGVPSFLGEMPSLKEVYLNWNILGGAIPEIWENLGGIIGLGLSGTGLVGSIPRSIGVYLRNACYLGLDNNSLEGFVPEEFGGLEFVNELNLGNNSLSGRLPFSAGFVSRLGLKLNLEGNLDLCIDESSAKVVGSSLQLRVCREESSIPKTALVYENSSAATLAFMLLLINSTVCLLFLVGFLG